MKIVILCVGERRHEHFEEAVTEYSTRVLRYAPLEFVFVSHDLSVVKEGEQIISKILKDDFVVLLDGKGSDIKTENLAELIENRHNDAVRRMVFIIGGAYGVSDVVKIRANYTWSLSKLIFPHLMVRVILLEQVYRAFSVLAGGKYHHG